MRLIIKTKPNWAFIVTLLIILLFLVFKLHEIGECVSLAKANNRDYKLSGAYCLINYESNIWLRQDAFERHLFVSLR